MKRYSKKVSRKRKFKTRRNNRKTRGATRGGGASRSSTTMPIAVQSYPLEPGTSSQRESAMKASTNMNSRQQLLNNKYGGGRKTTIYRGGGSCSVPKGPVVVPTFSNSGSSVSPVNANSTAAMSNRINMQASANACNDCYATGTCKGGGMSAYWKSKRR